MQLVFLIGKIPDGTKFAYSAYMESIPRKGDWISVLSLLPLEERNEYKGKEHLTVLGVAWQHYDVIAIDHDGPHEPDGWYPVILAE